MLLPLLAQLLFLPPLPDAQLPPEVPQAFRLRYPNAAVREWLPLDFGVAVCLGAFPVSGSADFDLALFSVNGEFLYEVRVIQDLAQASPDLRPTLARLISEHPLREFRQALIVTTAAHCRYLRLDFDQWAFGNNGLEAWFDSNGTPASRDTLPLHRLLFFLRVFQIQSISEATKARPMLPCA